MRRNELATKDGKYEPEKAFRHRVQQLKLDAEKEAQTIVKFLSKKMVESGYQDWQPWRVEFDEWESEVTLGTAYREKKLIQQHLYGEYVGVLLHEMAHQYGNGHDDLWRQTMTTLIELWEAHEAEIVELLKPTVYEKEDPEEMFESAVDVILDSQVVGTVTMQQIGSVLAQFEVNTTKNIQRVRMILKDEGVCISALTENSPY